VNAQEAVNVCRFVAAVTGQQMDALAPDVWGVVLAAVNIADAKAATVNLAKSRRVIVPADIVSEVRRIREARIAAVGDLTPPPGLGEAEERAWLRDARRVIGDGGTVDTARDGLRHRNVQAVVTKAARALPSVPPPTP
jgi:hypothetical protein